MQIADYNEFASSLAARCQRASALLSSKAGSLSSLSSLTLSAIQVFAPKIRFAASSSSLAIIRRCNDLFEESDREGRRSLSLARCSDESIKVA